jgi:hypothetical protein
MSFSDQPDQERRQQLIAGRRRGRPNPLELRSAAGVVHLERHRAVDYCKGVPAMYRELYPELIAKV